MFRARIIPIPAVFIRSFSRQDGMIGDGTVAKRAAEDNVEMSRSDTADERVKRLGVAAALFESVFRRSSCRPMEEIRWITDPVSQHRGGGGGGGGVVGGEKGSP